MCSYVQLNHSNHPKSERCATGIFARNHSGLRTLLFSTTEKLNKKCTNDQGQQIGIGSIQRNLVKKTLCKDTDNEIIPCQHINYTWYICCWWKSIQANYATIMELPRGHFHRNVSPTMFFASDTIKLDMSYSEINNKFVPVQSRQSPGLHQVMKNKSNNFLIVGTLWVNKAVVTSNLRYSSLWYSQTESIPLPTLDVSKRFSDILINVQNQSDGNKFI